MNKIIVTHGGQRQIQSEDGRTLAVDTSSTGQPGSTWFSPLGSMITSAAVLDLLTPAPKPQTLVMFFDVSGFNEDQINALVAEISAQAEDNDDHGDAEVGPEIILDGDINFASGAVAVGAGL